MSNLVSGGGSVEAELVALDVLHDDARLVEAIGAHQSFAHRAERDESCALGLERGQALLAHEAGAHPDVEMHPVLDDLALGDALEEESGTHPGGVDAGEGRALALRRLLSIELLPRGIPLRRRRHDVAQHLTPEARDALRCCAVEGDLDLPDRRHRPTIGAIGSAVRWKVRRKADHGSYPRPGVLEAHVA